MINLGSCAPSSAGVLGLARWAQCRMNIQALCARETIVGLLAGIFLGRWGRGGHDLAVILGVELFHEAGIAPA